MEVYIFFAVLVGLLCYSMAKRRGRDGNWGFLMGLVFGVFAVVAYVIIGDSEERKVERIKRALEK